jgi:tRNA dimethylallyltransferase
MRCVGYRQAWELLDAPSTDTPFPLARLRELGIAATRQLAKRQITWLRSMPAISPMNSETSNGVLTKVKQP